MSIDEEIRVIQLESEVAALSDQLSRLQEQVNDIKYRLDHHGEAA